jgi:phage shock protein PspC (stress-responsive transcriptional regulator)
MSEQPPRAGASLASRYGLVRPMQGRYVAGVCAGLGRATRTDPVLWRVVLAVLVCFAGIGAVIYLALWVLTPEEGDSASPVEALFGRGQSQTSPVLAVLLSAVAALLLLAILPRPLYLVLLGAVLVLAVLLLTNRIGPGAGPGAGAGPGPAAGAAAGPAAPGGAPTAAAPAADTPPTATAPAADTPPPRGEPGGGYLPPFAPHGPFAPRGPFAPPPPTPPPPPRERSVLPVLTFFAVLLVLGALGIVDLAGVLDVPVAGYVAAALAVVGGGLLAGAWLGPARGLIALGVVLALALPAVQAVETWEQPDQVGDITWVPQTRAEVDERYDVLFGAGLLDLRQVDLSTDDVEITVDVTFGDLRIIVPEDVPVEATVQTRFGNATVFHTTSAGVTRESVIEDGGTGDPDEAVLRLNLRVSFANMEVHR